MKANMLVHAYYAKNIGDDLFLKILVERYPNVNWYFLTANKDYKKIFHAYKNVHILQSLSVNLLGMRRVDLFQKLNQLLNYRKYDGLVTIGGSIFIEGIGWKEGLKRRSILPERLKKLNKKMFIIGSNFGPYSDQDYKEYHKDFFALFEDVCFRDHHSYNQFKDLGNIRVAPDVVFTLKANHYPLSETSVGFSLINLKNRKELKQYEIMYNQKVIEFIEYFVASGYKVKLFSFCEKEGDLEICQRIKEAVKKAYQDGIEIINYTGNMNEFLMKFQMCQLIIGTRFHSVILALLNGQNVFPIIYNEKTYNKLEDLHLESNRCFIKDMDSLTIEQVMNHSNNYCEETIYSEAEKQFAELDLFLKN